MIEGLETSEKFQKPFSQSKAFGRDSKDDISTIKIVDSKVKDDISTTATVDSSNHSGQSCSTSLDASKQNITYNLRNPEVQEANEINRGE